MRTIHKYSSFKLITNFTLVALFLLTMSCAVGDDESPSGIDDLSVSSNSKIFNWISPGDDSESGEATLYLIRFFDTEMVSQLLGVDSLEGISDQEIEQVVQDNFSDAIQVPQFFSPSPAGTSEVVAVPRIDLTGQTEYYFSVTTNDEVGNRGEPSNVVKVTTPLVEGSVTDENAESCLGASATSAEVGGKEADEDDASEFVRDLIVGDPCRSRVYVFFGGADVIGDVSSIDVGEADVTIIGPPDESFGAEVSGIGNFAERTTFEEFIIGAPDADNGAGKAYVFYGREDFPGTIDLTSGDQADVIINGENAGDNFGFSFARRGSDDVYVGAPGAPNNRGILYRFDGDDFNEVTNAASANDILIGEIGQGMFGYDVSNGGDVDGSTPDEFVVSAPGLGRVYVVFDTRDIDLSQDLSDVLVIQGNAEDRFGESISSGYDVDGIFIDDDDDTGEDPDEDTDLVVGAPGANNGAGSVFLYNNVDLEDAFDNGAPLSAAARINGMNEGDNFGASVELISDINPVIEVEDEDTANVMDQDITDADIVIGAPGSENGKVYVFFGREGFSGTMVANDADLILTPPDGTNAYGTAVYTINDINDDNFTDFAIGSENTIVVEY